ncbi:MAG TPA: CPBP family intramembrane glutamic endopeptidase [Kofleriaceae bacterium]
MSNPVSDRRGLGFAFGVCVLQPAVPAATLALWGRYIFTNHELNAVIPAWVLLAVAASGAATVAILVGGLLLRGGRLTPGDIGWRAESPARAIGLGVLGAAASAAAVFGTAALFGDDPIAGLHHVLGYTASQRALFAIVGVTLALVEESFFRGNLQARLAERIGPRAGYAITAIAYTVWHFPLFQAASMVARLGQGLIYGALRGRDRPLASCIAAHALCWAFIGLY